MTRRGFLGSTTGAAALFVRVSAAPVLLAGVPLLIPALTNAIHAASGRRVRGFPLVDASRAS